ncbi:MFS transporter [Aeromicrobium sp.]|uniref:MFS transporter n=1 Tax=Aeromicrobium sp. TaxID=1871063 RepID=UPI003D6ACAD4
MTLEPARRATTAIFVVNGFVLGMWVVNIPEILDRTGASKAQLGLLLLLLGGAALVGMQGAGRLVDQYGSRPVVVISALLLCAALLGPALATDVWTLAVGLALLGLTNGAVDVAQNAHAVEVERGYGRPVMSAFHAFFSLGGVLAAVLGGALIATGTDLRVSLGVAATAGLGATLAARSHLLAPGPRDHVERSGPRAPWSSRVVLLGALAFVLLLAEGVAYDWSTVHLHESLGAPKDVAAWAFGAFSVTMTVMRLLVDRIVARTGPAAFVRVAALVGAIALTGAALAPNAPTAIVAWGLFGIGLAGCVPQFFTAAGNIDVGASGTYVARVAGLGYLGLLAGPACVGLLTAWVPLTTAFVVPIVGCIAAGLLAPRVLHKEYA